MRKFKVLIADDDRDQLNLVQTSLLKGGDSRLGEQLRYKIAEELFEIQTFRIGGKAIKIIEDEDWKPDLALIDMRFNMLSWEEVIDSGESPDHEIDDKRGIAIVAAIKKKYPGTFLIAYTSSNGDDIFDALSTLGIENARYFLPVSEKDQRLSRLNERNVAILSQMAAQYHTRVDIDALRTAYEACAKNEEKLLNLEVDVAGEIFQMRHFMAHLAVVGADGTVHYPGLQAAIEELLEAPEQNAVPKQAQVGNYVRIEGFSGNGYWKHPAQRKNNAQLPPPRRDANIHQVILDFRNDKGYGNTIQNINKLAANRILKIVHANQITQLPLKGFEGFNIGNEFHNYVSAPWTNTFHKALQARRIILGLFDLLNEFPDLFKKYNDNPHPNAKAANTIFHFGNFGKVTNGNIKKILCTYLGFEVTGFGEPNRAQEEEHYIDLEQRIQIHNETLLDEERTFLDKYVRENGQNDTLFRRFRMQNEKPEKWVPFE